MCVAIGGIEDELEASNRWSHTFKSRYNIRFMTVAEKKRSSNVDVAEKFVTWIINYVRKEKLCEHQIFYCDETALNYKNIWFQANHGKNYCYGIQQCIRKVEATTYCYDKISQT